MGTTGLTEPAQNLSTELAIMWLGANFVEVSVEMSGPVNAMERRVIRQSVRNNGHGFNILMVGLIMKW